MILVKGKFLSTITDIMQNALADLSVWANDISLGINTEKTELDLFTRKCTKTKTSNSQYFGKTRRIGFSENGI